MNNIIDFGAIGDGVTVNTEAIQRAIDAGGVVYVPSGVFVTGTLYLKSHGGLHLAPGAVLRASTDREDYNAVDYCPQNAVFASEFMAGTHLITAVEQEDVFIEGSGCIDGYSHYWVNESLKYPSCDFWGHPPADANRPAQMIFFAECKRVRVENVRLKNSPFWHLFFHGCEDVFVRGVQINGEKKQWVNDGIDVDCCSRVTISDCIISTGDDGITLRANGKRLVNKDAVCEDVVISNCIITSYLDYGIRIGVGNGIIRNCSFSNIIIKNSLNGIGVTCRFSPAGSCTTVENVSFNGVSIDALRGVLLKVSDFQNHPPLLSPIHLKDMYFSNMIVKSNRSNYILGFDGAEMNGIYFNNSRFFIKKEDRDNDRYTNGRWDIKEKDSVVYVSKAKNVVFSGCGFANESPEYFSRNVASDAEVETLFINTEQ